MRARVDCQFEIKAVNDDGRIEGFAAVFGNVDLGLDRIEPGAFSKTIRGVKRLPMIWQHDTRMPIGVWDEFREERKGLRIGGDINLEIQNGRDARSLTKQGAVTGLSIDYIPTKFSFDGDVRVLEEVDLMGTSLVTFPMNTEARVLGIKHVTVAEFERELREGLGLSRKAAAAIRRGGFEAFKKLSVSREAGDDIGSDGLANSLHRLTESIRHRIPENGRSE